MKIQNGIKIAVIGGGSTYTPELLDGFIQSNLNEGIAIKEICLLDVDENRLKTVSAFCKRMVEHSQSNFLITTSDDLTETLRGADFVLTQFRVGGMQARHEDILLGHRHGIIGQETVGVGGFAKALRTIPFIQKIIDTMHMVCPDAWLINFTNPVSIITEYLSRYTKGIKWVGLCNFPVNITKSIAKELNSSDSQISFDYYGLNHFSWINNIKLNGENVTQKVISRTKEMKRMKNIPAEQFSPELLDDLQMIPNYYLLYYYNTIEVLAKKLKAGKTRAEEVMEVEEELLKQYSNVELCTKPASLEKRGGAYYSTVAVDLIKSIISNKGNMQILNVANNGTIKELPNESSIEVKCRVYAEKIVPVSLPQTPDKIKGLLNQVKQYEIYTAETALTGSKATALKALETNPLTNTCNTIKLLDDILETNCSYINLK